MGREHEYDDQKDSPADPENWLRESEFRANPVEAVPDDREDHDVNQKLNQLFHASNHARHWPMVNL